MGYDSFSGKLGVTVTWNPQNNGPTASYGTVQAPTTLAKSITYVKGGNLANGVNVVYSALLTIAASGSTTIDLTSITEVLGSSKAFARIKAVIIQLLSTADDSTNGSACSGITVGNAASTPNKLFMHAGTDTFDLANGDIIAWGTGAAAGIVVDSSNKGIKIVNNDGAVGAKVLLTVLGADA